MQVVCSSWAMWIFSPPSSQAYCIVSLWILSYLKPHGRPCLLGVELEEALRRGEALQKELLRPLPGCLPHAVGQRVLAGIPVGEPSPGAACS